MKLLCCHHITLGVPVYPRQFHTLPHIPPNPAYLVPGKEDLYLFYSNLYNPPVVSRNPHFPFPSSIPVAGNPHVHLPSHSPGIGNPPLPFSNPFPVQGNPHNHIPCHVPKRGNPMVSLPIG